MISTVQGNDFEFRKIMGKAENMRGSDINVCGIDFLSSSVLSNHFFSKQDDRFLSFARIKNR